MAGMFVGCGWRTLHAVIAPRALRLLRQDSLDCSDLGTNKAHYCVKMPQMASDGIHTQRLVSPYPLTKLSAELRN